MNDSSADASHCVAVLNAVQEIEAAEVNEAINGLWAEIKSDASAQQAALAAGLDERALASTRPPFVASRDKSNIGVAETIAIFIALEASRALIDKAVDEAWDKVFKDYFWPRLRAKFGAKLKPRK